MSRVQSKITQHTKPVKYNMNEKKQSTNTDNWVFFSYLTKTLKQSTKYFKQVITNGLETTKKS